MERKNMWNNDALDIQIQQQMQKQIQRIMANVIDRWRNLSAYKMSDKFRSEYSYHTSPRHRILPNILHVPSIFSPLTFVKQALEA